jgi:ribonuclease Z
MPSGQVIVHNERHYLIDCGEGTQMQIQRYGLRLSRLDAIFISHLHGDHVLGLPGLLNTLSILSRQDKLVLVGPKGLQEYLEMSFRISGAKLNFSLELLELDSASDLGVPVYESKALRVLPVPLRHRIPCFGYVFEEKPKPRPLLKDHPLLAEVPNTHLHLLKLGNDISLADGTTVHAEDVLGPPPPCYRYAYCSDNRAHAELAPWVRGVDVLYHEATFLHVLKARAEETQHSTCQEAAEFAKLAGAGQLIIGHYSARYTDLQPLLQEAQLTFPNTALAREGLVFTIPQEA